MTTNNATDLDFALNTDADPTYQNENYLVFIFNMEGTDQKFTDGNFQYDECYVVVNRANGVVEHACVRMPEACFIAYQLNKALIDPPWAWADKVVDAAPEETPPPVPTVN